MNGVDMSPVKSEITLQIRCVCGVCVAGGGGGEAVPFPFNVHSLPPTVMYIFLLPN